MQKIKVFLLFLFSIMTMELSWADNVQPDNQTPVTSLTSNKWYYIKWGEKYLSYDKIGSDYKVVLKDAPDLGATWEVESQEPDNASCTSWKIRNYKTNSYLGFQQRSANYVAGGGQRTDPYTITYSENSFSLLSAPIWWNSPDTGKQFYMSVDDQGNVVGSETQVPGWQFYGGLDKATVDQIAGNALLLLKATRLYLAFGTTVNHIVCTESGKSKFANFEDALKAITGEDVANATESTMQKNSTGERLTALSKAYNAINLNTDVRVVAPTQGVFYRLKSVASGKYVSSQLNGSNFPMMTDAEGNNCLSTLVQYTSDGKLQFLESGKAINSEAYRVSDLASAATVTIARSGYSANETLGSYSICASNRYLFAGSDCLNRISEKSNFANCEWYLEEITSESLVYSRAMSNQWGTLCLPYTIQADAAKTNYDFYQIQSVENDVMTISRIADGQIPAGTPVVVRCDTGVEGIVIPAADATLVMNPVQGSSANGLTLQGTFVGTTISSGYYIAKNAFWDATGKKIAVSSYRAYFEGAVSGASQLRIAVTEENETPLEIVETSVESPLLYNLAGEQIPALQKGVNLVRKADGTVHKIIIP